MTQQDDNKQKEVRPQDGRMPPNDLAAEAAVLSDIILHPPNYDAAASILPVPEAFYSVANRWIYKAVAHMNAEGNGAVDFVTVRSLLKDWGRLDQIGGTAYLTKLTDSTPAVANVEEHARIVRAKWVQRQAIGIHQRFVAEGYGDVGEPREWIENAEKALNEIASLGSEADLRVAGTVLGEHMRALDAAKARGESMLGVTTGLVDLDKKTGGLYQGDLTVVAGRPGLGKTQFALNIALATASVPCTDDGDDAPKYQNGVAFFSLEMPNEQLAMRLGCTMTKTELSKARQNLLKDDDRTRLWGAANDLVKTPLWIDDTAAISLAQLRSRVRKLKRQIETKRSSVPCNRLALVVVDYLQLMTGVRNRGDSREREVAGLSAGLKQLAKELDVPVMALSQLNRTVEKSGKKNKRPMLSDLRESGAVENDADNVWFLYRDSYYEKQANPTEAEVIIGKQRSGPVGTVYVEFKREYGKFYNSTRRAPEEEEDYGEHIFAGDNAEGAFDDLDDV